MPSDKEVIYRGAYIHHVLTCMNANRPDNAKSWIMLDSLYWLPREPESEPVLCTIQKYWDEIIQRWTVKYETVGTKTENAEGAGI